MASKHVSFFCSLSLTNRGVKWNKEIWNTKSNPGFLLSKASQHHRLSEFLQTRRPELALTHLLAFCSSANLLCFPDLASSLEKHDKDSNFAGYADQNFTNYDTNRSVWRSRLVQDLLQQPELASGLIPSIQPGLHWSQRQVQKTTHRMETWWTIEDRTNYHELYGFQWLHHLLHRPFRRVREIRLSQCRLDFLGKVREGNQTERKKERAEVKVFWSTDILLILIIG